MAASSAIRGRCSSRSRNSAATSATTAPSRSTPRRGRARLPLARGGAGDRPRRRARPAAPRRCSPWATSPSCAGAGARGAGGAGARDDHLVPDRDVRAGPERDRPAAARQPRRDDAAMRSPPCVRVTASRASCWRAPRAAVRTRPGRTRQPRQAPGGTAGDAAAGRRAARALHHRHPDRHRRDAGGADRGAAGDRRDPRAIRPYPGSHHPELPCQAAHQAGGRGGAGPGRPALDHRRGAAGAGRGDEHPGAAEPVARRLPRLVAAGLDDWGGVSR